MLRTPCPAAAEVPGAAATGTTPEAGAAGVPMLRCFDPIDYSQGMAIRSLGLANGTLVILHLP